MAMRAAIFCFQRARLSDFIACARIYRLSQVRTNGQHRGDAASTGGNSGTTRTG